MHKLRNWAVLATVVLAACGDSGGSSSTATTDAEHSEGTVSDGHTADPTATCSPSGTSLSISANNIEFNTKCLAVPAGEKFTVNFDNQESVNHNFAILAKSGKGDPLSDTGIFPGPAVRNLQSGPLEAGNYLFHCIVHPNMTGTLVVK